MLTPEAMGGLSKAYLKYAAISEQFEEDSVVLAHQKSVEVQLKSLESTLQLPMDAVAGNTLNRTST
jgi:hypothetical protein